ncbi:hypothetical protein WR25_18122 [Diploscapter pachys]|uniref:Uncharacterized protein n=2 Tax=cellular organisms TaxID=131567 RepID=A0A2A2K977_9BILA|nr:hypothetical protein WR25_18122 [Diploscapter pachys]
MATWHALGQKAGARALGNPYRHGACRCPCTVHDHGWRDVHAPWIHQEKPENAFSRSGPGQATQGQLTEVNYMNPHIGSNFDDFLAEEGILEEVTAAALKRVIAWQLTQAMKQQKISKKALAERMHTSRAAVDRALDQTDAGMTLATLASAARALGQRVEIRLVPDVAPAR